MRAIVDAGSALVSAPLKENALGESREDLVFAITAEILNSIPKDGVVSIRHFLQNCGIDPAKYLV